MEIQHLSMKTEIKILFILFFLLNSCGLWGIYDNQVTRYSIVNDSSYKMEVTGFNKKVAFILLRSSLLEAPLNNGFLSISA